MKKKSTSLCEDFLKLDCEYNSYCRQRKANKEIENSSKIIMADENFKCSDFDTNEMATKLSLMEELCFIALGAERAQMSFLNDNISYVIRSCIIIELALAHRIKLNINEGKSLDEPWNLNIVISDSTPTDDIFLDETMINLAKENMSIKKWLDVLTGEIWSRQFSGLQICNLRDRLCKSLMEKGLVTTKKSSLFLIETTEYPLLNESAKRTFSFKNH